MHRKVVTDFVMLILTNNNGKEPCWGAEAWLTCPEMSDCNNGSR